MNTHEKQQPLSHSKAAEWIRPTATFDTFSWEDAPSLDKEVFLQLAACKFIDAGQNVIFCGPGDSSKTHLANALSAIALQAGYSVNLVDSARLDARFSWQACVESYLVDCDLLLVCDPHPTEQLREILKQRQKRSTLLLTTLPPDQLLGQLIPADARLEALRAAWAGAVLVEFNQSQRQD
jgi:hypothetical protein